MAGHQGDDIRRKERLTDRRSVLKAVGGTAAALGASSALGSAAGQVDGVTLVDLGEEGLSNGDSINSYLETYFQSGTEVHIPAGEYSYSGSGLGGDYSDAALIGAPEGVVFHRPDDPEQEVRPTMFAESGTVRIENITVRGKRGESQSRWRVGAASDARFEVLNVNLPDGTVENSDSTGIYAGTDHAGTLWLKNCYFSNFGNVALYVSDPHKGGNGQVVVEDCDFVNTGTEAVRCGSDDSVVRGCYFEATQSAPSGPNGQDQRGIGIDEPGSNLVIEDCDFNWSDVGTMAIQFDDEGQDGSGTVRNIRVYNDGGTTFVDQWGVEGSWSGENIHLTGDGDHNCPSHFDEVTGSDAQEPDTSYEIWTPVDADVTDDSPVPGAGSYDHILIEASPNNPDANLDVSFTTTGPITYAAEAESGTDTIEQNDDGTYTATSVEMDPGALDSFEFSGEIVDYSVTDGYELAGVEVDGQATTFAELVGETDSSGDSGGDGSSSDGGTDGSDSDPPSGGSGSGSSARVLIVDGTGDAEEIAQYEITVTGSLERDESRSVVNSDGLPSDRLTDHVGDSRAAGIVGNGKDAYRFTGEITSLTIEGKAGITLLGE